MIFCIESRGIQLIIAYRTEKTKQTVCILMLFILPRFSLSFVPICDYAQCVSVLYSEILFSENMHVQSMFKQKILAKAKTQAMCCIARNRSHYFTYDCSFDLDCCISTDSTMDKFVTVTKKGETVDSAPANSDPDNNCEPSSTTQKSEQSQPKTVARKFNSQWENDYFVIENKGKTLCLLCRHEFSENKKYTIDRHFTSKHGAKHTKFLDPDKRKTEIAQLNNELQAEKKSGSIVS